MVNNRFAKPLRKKEFFLFARNNRLRTSKLLIIVKKNTIKNANRRNYIKRILKNIFLDSRFSKLGFDFVFFLNKDFGNKEKWAESDRLSLGQMDWVR